MKLSTRLTLAFSLLIGIFVLATVLVVVGLALLRNPTMALVAGIAGLACVAAAGIGWLIVRTLQQLGLDDALEQTPELLENKRPLKVQSLPVAELPPAYLDAVMKGVRRNQEALKARSAQL